jgi:hypothetical protein
MGEGGGGGGRGARSYYGEKDAWPSINHSIVSGFTLLLAVIMATNLFAVLAHGQAGIEHLEG